ncbi:hypothetical protein AVEN_145054-1 [Araneus ventricosus]|uniref:Uncharacterized protein n=1 Tax=Araneus ventricosus TaxID=182803 RepID=A0A4Y2WBY9_ARAVE|nr:hypothetical protein AVEN_145054-1 [Araneus ventricosus]
MQKRSDLSDVQKGMIIGFRAKGGSISETSNFVNCSRAAVVKVYRAWQYGTIQNQRCGTCGEPRAIDGSYGTLYNIFKQSIEILKIPIELALLPEVVCYSGSPILIQINKTENLWISQPCGSKCEIFWSI